MIEVAAGRRSGPARRVVDMSPEQAFLTFGPVWVEAPPIHTMKEAPGVAARVSLEALMASVESGADDAEAIVDVLAYLVAPNELRVDLAMLGALKPLSWDHVTTVLNLVRLTQRVAPSDFADGGARLTAVLARFDSTDAE